MAELRRDIYIFVPLSVLWKLNMSRSKWLQFTSLLDNV